MLDRSVIERARNRGLDRYLDRLNLKPDPELVLPESVVARQMFRNYHQLRDRPGDYRVEFIRDAVDEFHDPTDFYLMFRIRDTTGNVTPIGRSLGIETLDPRVELQSPEGIAIDGFLCDLARNYAGQLAKGRGYSDRISNMPPGLKRRVWNHQLDEYVVR